MRHLVRRVGSALLGAWLAFVIAEPVPMHACAMHGDVVGATTPHAPHTAKHAPIGPHASHAPSHAEHAAAPAATPEPDEPGPLSHGACLCLGDCCAAGAPLAPSAAVSSVATTLVRTDEPAAQAVRVVSPSADQVRIPWANGPPAIG